MTHKSDDLNLDNLTSLLDSFEASPPLDFTQIEQNAMSIPDVFRAHKQMEEENQPLQLSKRVSAAFNHGAVASPVSIPRATTFKNRMGMS